MKCIISGVIKKKSFLLYLRPQTMHYSGYNKLKYNKETHSI